MRVSVTSVGGKEKKKKWRKKKNKRAKEMPERERASKSQVDGGREINFNH
jgi:hypothetical protein